MLKLIVIITRVVRYNRNINIIIEQDDNAFHDFVDDELLIRTIQYRSEWNYPLATHFKIYIYFIRTSRWPMLQKWLGNGLRILKQFELTWNFAKIWSFGNAFYNYCTEFWKVWWSGKVIFVRCRTKKFLNVHSSSKMKQYLAGKK